MRKIQKAPGDDEVTPSNRWTFRSTRKRERGGAQGFVVLDHDTGLPAFELGGSMLRHEGICVVVVGMVFLSTVHDARGRWTLVPAGHVPTH